MAPEVDIAVRLTTNATLPLAIELMKFEIFPLGQAATVSFPKQR